MHDDSSPPEGGDVFGNANALAKGTRLSEFEIERVLGEGGFAIVYLAFDHSLHRHVALKEYLPAEFAFRQDQNTIVLRSGQHQKTFEAGRKSFVQEARFLAQFEHPSLVKVHRVFEANGTAYMVQGYYPGESLGAALKSGRRYASEAELRPLVAALVAAAELLHSRQCLHRDIAPDNIIIQPSGVPVLLDFGAARRIIGDMTQALTAVLKPSFAPIEQYTEDGGLAQGPWTDVYALAATLRTAITGKPPPSSVGRTIKDALVKLADDPPPNFGLPFLRGLDAGLALLPADRPQTMAAFRAAMGLEPGDEPTAPPIREARPVEPAAPRAQPREATVPGARSVPAPPIPVATAASPPPPSSRPAAQAPPARRRFKRSDAMLAVIAAAAVGLMLVVPFAADWIWPSPATMSHPQVARESRPPAPSPTAPVVPPSAMTPSPAPTAPVAPPAAPTVTPPVPAPAAVPPPPAAVASGPAPVAPPAPKEATPVPPAPKPPAASPAAPPPVAPSTTKVAAAPSASVPPKQEAPRPPAPAPSPTPPSPAPVPPPPSPAPSTSLIPAPSQPAAAAPAVPSPATPASRDDPSPKPAAVSPGPAPTQAASLPPPDAAKARRVLVRVSGEPPVYPRDAIRAGVESGRVVALVTVDAQGNVAGVDIVRSEPPRVFDRSARAALAAWKFRPEGERYQGEVELLFRLRE